MAVQLHLLHININGLRAKKVELESYLAETKPDILLINETKLGSQPTPRLAGFQVASVRNRSADKVRGGGVAIYVKRELKFTDISPDVDDIAAIEIKTPNKSFAIISYYRPPYEENINAAVLIPFIQKYDHCIIAGDLNAKHEYFGCKKTNKAGDQLFDLIEQHDLIIANDSSETTHRTISTGNTELLDLFVVTRNMSGLLDDCYVGDDVGSDHLPVHLRVKLGGTINKFVRKEVRLMTSCNWEKFTDVIDDSIDVISDAALTTCKQIDTRCDEIQCCITKAIDSACPLRTVRDHAFRLSQDTLELIRKKRRIRRLHQRHNDPGLRTLYNNLGRQVSAAIKAEKQRSWQEATASLDGLVGRKLWTKFKVLTGANVSSDNNARVKVESGDLTTSNEETANEFAKHLGKVHKTHNGPEFDKSFRLSCEKSVSSKASMYRSCSKIIREDGDDSFLVAEIRPAEISIAFQKCKTKSAPGEHGINYSMIKHLPNKMLLILAQLYTICLLVGYFPLCWKSAIGIMLLKPKKDKRTVSNYRPISLLSTIGKLFEKIVSMRMHAFFRETKFFNQWQRAYLSEKEASEHTYRLGQSIALAKGRHWVTTAISLDVEKAFDSVWHDGMRYKLTALKLPIKLVRLLSSFLTDRSIRVRVGSELSKPVSLQAGTPQGSVLSPLLFLIYVNDVPIHPSNKCDAGQFADDLSLWTYAKKKKHTFMRLQRALNDIELWCTIWRIKLNVAKTQLDSFPRRKEKLELKLFNQTIKEQKELTLLGVTFDEQYSLKAHCAEKAKKAISRVNLLKRLSGQTWGANSRTLLMFYKQYVRPVLETGSVNTADAKKSHLAKLQRVQNSALRVALHLPYWTRITRLHKLARIVPIAKRLKTLQSHAVKRFAASQLMVYLKNQKLLLEK